ncbi:MAG: hypothetical protein AAF813_02410 [Pseudomonadota bacterium]
MVHPLQQTAIRAGRADHSLAGHLWGYGTIIQWTTLLTFGLVFVMPLGLIAFVCLFVVIVLWLTIPPLGLIALCVIGSFYGGVLLMLIAAWVGCQTIGTAVWLAIRATLARAGVGPTFSATLAAAPAHLAGFAATREVLALATTADTILAFVTTDAEIWGLLLVVVLPVSMLVSYAVYYER